MKKDLHPTYYPTAVITCACGATYHAGSTQEATAVEVCAACHPFFTGKQHIVDSARRVEKFGTRAASKATAVKTAKEKAKDRAVRATKKATKRAARDTTIKTLQS